MDELYRSDHSAREIIPVKRKYDQRYVMYTSESSQMDIIPPLINQAHLSRYILELALELTLDLNTDLTPDLTPD